MSLDSLLNIFKKIQSQHTSFGTRFAQAEALNRWKLAVGDSIAKHARALHVQNNVLWVEVDHPIWKTELHYRKRQILTILNHTSSKELFEDIHYVEKKF